MKRSWAVVALLMVLLVSNATSQELSIGPTGGALFTGGSRGHNSDRHGLGSQFALGGEVVYSLSSIPIDLVGKGFFSPSEGRFHRRDSLNALPNHEGRTGDGSSLFSLGLGGRWVPLRGPVSPYLGLSFLVSHQEGGVFGRDSSETVDAGESNLPDRLDHGGKGVTRFGAEVSVGSEFVLSTLIRLDVGASYSFNSPFDRGRNLSAIGFGASVLFTLF